MHKFLESKRKFTDWVKPYVSLDNEYGFVEGTDFIRTHAGVNPTNGLPLDDYWFTMDMAKEVSMLSKTEQGKKARKYFIECEKKALNPTAALPNFADPAEAAIAWANEYKEKQTLQLERDEAIKTRGQIRDKQLASAMGTAGALANKMKALEAKVGVIDTVKAKAVEFATILAIQSRVENLKASGLKLANYCRQKGLEIHAIPDERYGKIQSYPAQAWKDVYNININQVLGM